MSEIKMVLVEWEDSNVIHGWRPDDCRGDDIAHCRTVGILKAEGDISVTVALGDSDCGSVLETITIPRGCIKSIKKLRCR